jgi:hypothetical protein
MYYGGGLGARWHWHRWVSHPLHLLWWLRLYRGLYIRHHLPRLQALIGL